MKKSKAEYEFPIIEIVVSLMAMLGICAMGSDSLGAEFSVAMAWWAVLLLLGISCMPLTSLIFSGFHDGGWIFSKVFGLAVGGWLLWVMSSLHLLKFNTLNTWIIVIFVFLANYGLAFFLKKNKKTAAWIEKVQTKSERIPVKKGTLAVAFELVFLGVFLLASYIKCFNPDATNTTEQFMDYGFMTSMMRSDYMPPEDMWLSGNPINYYYLGQYFATFLTRLSGVPVSKGYSLSLAMLCAFCFILSYSLIYEVIRLAISLRDKRREKKTPGDVTSKGYAAFVSHVGGVLAGIATTFAGNGHYIIYAKLIPMVKNMLGMEVKNYWFPDATRYIGYNPPTNDKTIHEFPAYSFVLGDLHAHVTNIIFVLAVVGCLFAWLLYRREHMEEVNENRPGRKYSRLLEVFHPAVVMIGFFIGIFQMNNYWDFPIYFVVSGAIILFSNAVIHKFGKETLILTALHAVVVLGVSTFVSFLFNLHFDSMAGGIGICTKHTPLYQLGILWGLPVMGLIMYFVSLIGAAKEEGKYDRRKKAQPLLFQFIARLEVPDLFALTIGLCAAGLVLMPEVVYVVDIYGGDYTRSNTMFKLTYQAFILFGLMLGYIITKFLLLSKNTKQLVCGIILGVFLLGNTGYIGTSVESWFGDVKDETRFQGLDVTVFIDKTSPSDAAAIDWINENIEGTPVILEANGGAVLTSYTYTSRVSAFTGLPTVMGWFTHEWLWRNDYKVAETRSNDVRTMYTSGNLNEIRTLLEKYEVEYIYIGDHERSQYADTGINEAALHFMGSVVYENDSVSIIKVYR